jgi:DNA relaxase NicK
MAVKSFYLFDWISFTAKHMSVFNVQELLGLDHISWEAANGAHGYKNAVFFGKIKIHYNGNYDTVWCEMSGQGCRTYETFGRNDYSLLFKELVDEKQDYNITRVDIAFDDHDELINIDRLFVDTMNEHFVSKSNKFIYTGGDEGLSIKHGNTKTVIRIYDKAAERGKKEDGHWIRVELQLRDNNAFSFVEKYVANNGTLNEVYTGTINNYLRYVSSGSDSNRWRWPMKTYWKNFIDTAEKIQLYKKPGIDYNEYKHENYVVNMSGGAALAYIEMHGLEEYYKKIKKQHPDLNPKYKMLINEHKEREKLKKKGKQKND